MSAARAVVRVLSWAHRRARARVVTRVDDRFFASSRGRIITLLQRGGRTVDDLARALGLTGNAVRAHLAILERDGLVRPMGVRRGAGKPAATYALTSAAERLFPKPYGLVLQLLLDALGERLTPDALEAVLRDVGRRLAALHVAGSADRSDPRTRRTQAVELYRALGGLPELDEDGRGGFVLRSYSCPLATATQEHPAACLLAEALLAAVIGAPVRETCVRGDPVRCTFQVPAV